MCNLSTLGVLHGAESIYSKKTSLNKTNQDFTSIFPEQFFLSTINNQQNTKFLTFHSIYNIDSGGS